MDSYMERKGGFVFENPNAAKTLQQSSEIRERSSIASDRLLVLFSLSPFVVSYSEKRGFFKRYKHTQYLNCFADLAVPRVPYTLLYRLKSRTAFRTSQGRVRSTF